MRSPRREVRATKQRRSVDITPQLRHVLEETEEVTMKRITIVARLIATVTAVVALLVFAAGAASAEHKAGHTQEGGNADAGCVTGNPSEGSACQGGNGGQAGGGVGCQGGSQADRDEPCGRDTGDGTLNTGGNVPGVDRKSVV